MTFARLFESPSLRRFARLVRPRTLRLLLVTVLLGATLLVLSFGPLAPLRSLPHRFADFDERSTLIERMKELEGGGGVQGQRSPDRRGQWAIGELWEGGVLLGEDKPKSNVEGGEVQGLQRGAGESIGESHQGTEGETRAKISPLMEAGKGEKSGQGMTDSMVLSAEFLNDNALKQGDDGSPQGEQGEGENVESEESNVVEESRKVVGTAERERLLTELPLCARGGQKARGFLLVFMGHSGSTAIMTELKQHSETFIEGFEPVDHGEYQRNPDKALQYADEFFSNVSRMGKVGGFKIRPTNILRRRMAFRRLVEKWGLRIIWNFRMNLFKQAVGHYTIERFHDYTAYEGIKVDGNEAPKDRKTRFKIHDMNVLHEILVNRRRGEEMAAIALQAIAPDGCVLPVTYESYLEQRDITMGRVQAFLGINIDERHPPLRKKATGDSLCNVLENYNEVCDNFYGCQEYQWMLDDWQNGCSCTLVKPSNFARSRKYCLGYRMLRVRRPPPEKKESKLPSTTIGAKPSTPTRGTKQPSPLVAGKTSNLTNVSKPPSTTNLSKPSNSVGSPSSAGASSVGKPPGITNDGKPSGVTNTSKQSGTAQEVHE